MEIRFEFTNDELTAAIDRAIAASLDFTPAMEAIAGHMEDAVAERFEQENDPQGTAWAKSLRVMLHGGKTLDRGLPESLLRGGFESTWDANSATVGTNVIYAAIHQVGFKGNVSVAEHKRKSGAKVKAHTRDMNIPARPFLGFGPQDEDAIVDILSDHLRRAFEGR